MSDFHRYYLWPETRWYFWRHTHRAAALAALVAAGTAVLVLTVGRWVPDGFGWWLAATVLIFALIYVCGVCTGWSLACRHNRRKLFRGDRRRDVTDEVEAMARHEEPPRLTLVEGGPGSPHRPS